MQISFFLKIQFKNNSNPAKILNQQVHIGSWGIIMYIYLYIYI